MDIKSVKDLDVYKLAFQLTLDIYNATTGFPKYEQFGIVPQMRRAAVSICSNLAEGCARGTVSEYRHFVAIARGSAAELECQIELSMALNFVDKNIANDLITRIQRILRMLAGLKNSLAANNQQPSTNN